MGTFHNTEIVDYLLNRILKVIEKRSSNIFAITAINAVIKQLTSEFPVLQYIHIDTNVYSETWIPYSIDQHIENIEEEDLGKALSEMIYIISKAVSDDDDYYLLREIRDELPYDIDVHLKKIGVNLTSKQFEYVLFKGEDKKTEILNITNTETLNHFFSACIEVVQTIFPVEKTQTLLSSIIKKLEKHKGLTTSITISYQQPTTLKVTCTIDEQINAIAPEEIGAFIHRMIQEIGVILPWQEKETLINHLKTTLTADDLEKFHLYRVNLDEIDRELKRQKHQQITYKVCVTLYTLIQQRTDSQQALSFLKQTLEKLQATYPVLETITITSTTSQEETLVTINEDINQMETPVVGKALRELISTTVTRFGDHTFFDEFKQMLGESYLPEIEHMGVNLHMLELRFGR